jgi:hypothetical protein
MRKERFDRESWRAQLPAWCVRTLGARPVATIFEGGSQSAVVGLRLDDGREVAVKIRPNEARVAACHRVHRHVYAQRFPCPEPLVAPTPLGRYVATAERYVGGGQELPASPDRTERFAKVLARLMRAMPPVIDVPPLEPPPAWAWWNHPSRGLWPPAAEGHVDLNAHTEPTWLVETVTRARTRLRAATLPSVVGHADWQSAHLRWVDGEIHAVFDWDSVCALPEATVVGLAAAMFAMSEDTPASSLAETSDFIGAYAIARGQLWTHEEQQLAWAASVWTMAYLAKGEAIDNAVGPATALLFAQREERLRRAGC